MKQFHYVGNIRLPTEKAHGLQIMHNCEALAAHADVTLYPGRLGQPPELRGLDPWVYYDLPPAFTIRAVPCIDLIGLTGGRTNAFSQAVFYLQTATYSLSLLAMLRRAAPDAVYYGRHPLVLAFLRRFKPARRIFWEVHSLSAEPGRRQAQADLARQIGGAIAVTAHLAERLIGLGVPAERVLVAPDGIRAARFQGLPTPAEARAALGLPPEAVIVGYLGRLHTLNMGKGVDDLIQAIARADRPLHLLLVGGPDDLAARYRQQWTGLGLPGERFHALGQVPAAEVPRALAAFDVAAMPFPWTEHFAYYASPIKLFEYMAGGRAILATDLPSTAEIVADGETALLVPPSDVGAMAAALVRLHDDPELRARLGAAARRLAFERYTWGARAKAIMAFIDRLSTQDTPRPAA